MPNRSFRLPKLRPTTLPMKPALNHLRRIDINLPNKYEIVDRGDYIRVQLQGVIGFHDITAIIGQEIALPRYRECNDIWCFGPEFLNLCLEDLQSLTDLIARIYPSDATRSKSALVVPHGFNHAIVELWADTAANLPFEVKIFTEEPAAVAWVES